MFRDETVRVKQKVLSVVRPVTVITSDDSPKSISTVDVDELDMMETSHLSTMMPTTHVKDVAAGFYFTNYTFVAPPLSTEYNEWLTEAYQNDRPSGILRSIIDAVGLAALANIYYAPQIATISKEKYCHALSSMRSALQDPVVAKEDTTFMTVILLGLYETVNLATWDSYHHWEAHVQGAIILLALRGSEQFSHERGGQLFMQIRSQILLACMQQNMAVPPALIDLTRSFEASTMRHNLRRRKLASAGSISEVSFRVVNLRAACRSGEIGDPKMIRDMSLAIDHDLLSWRTSVPTEWDYIESTPSDRSSTTYEGLCHTYPTIWIAEILNNWRTLRIIVNQMIMNNAEQLSGGHEPYEASALAAIKELSKELCASVPGFSDTPRKSTRTLTSTFPLTFYRQNVSYPSDVRCCDI